MRCSIIEILGSIIGGHLINDKTEGGVKQTLSFFAILEERFRDVNAFVRGRVLSVLGDLFR